MSSSFHCFHNRAFVDCSLACLFLCQGHRVPQVYSSCVWQPGPPLTPPKPWLLISLHTCYPSAHQLCSISSLVLHHSSPGCYFSRCLMKVLHHHELCAFDSCVDSDSRTNLLPISCACQPNQTWSHPLPSSPLSTSSPPTSFPQPSPAVNLLHLHPPPLPDCKQ